MPDPDPKVTVPSDADLWQIAYDCERRYLDSDTDIPRAEFLIEGLQEVRDRTEEATLRRVLEMKLSEIVREIRAAEEARK